MKIKCLKASECSLKAVLAVTGAFMITAIIDGQTYNIGMFVVYWVRDYEMQRFAFDWVSSLQVAATYCIGPICGMFLRHFSFPEVTIFGSLLSATGNLLCVFNSNVLMLYLFYGILTGLGNGFVYMSAVVAMTTNFNKLRPIALGVMACGSGIGAAVFSKLLNYLFNMYTWRGSLFITAGLLLNCCIFGSLLGISKDVNDPNQMDLCNDADAVTPRFSNCGSGFLRLPEEFADSTLPLKSEEDLIKLMVQPKLQHLLGSLGSFLYLVELRNLVPPELLMPKRSVWRKTSFVAFAFGLFFYSLGCYAPILYLYERMLDLKIDETQATTLMSVFGLTNAVARLYFAMLTTSECVKKKILLTSIVFILGVLHAFSCFFQKLWAQYIYVIGMGACSGGMVVTHPLVVAELVRVDQLTNAIGNDLLLFGFGCFFGTPLAGLIIKLANKLDIYYLTASGIMFLSSIFFLICHFLSPNMTEADIGKLRYQFENAFN